MKILFPSLIVLLSLIFFACANSKKRDHSNDPIVEQTVQRPDATPTPRPTAPIDRPLDPSGRPR